MEVVQSILNCKFIGMNNINEIQGLFLQKTYYSSGKLKEIYYIDKNNKMQGQYMSYYESGKLKESANLINDKLHGLYLRYYENDQIKESFNYNNGILTGQFKKYLPNGDIEYSTLLD